MENTASVEWNAINMILGWGGPFIIGAVMRYASRKWARPLLVTLCLIAVIAVGLMVDSIGSGFFRNFNLYVILIACMMSGAFTADLIYRIRGRRKRK